MNPITTNDQIIDSRDVIDRIEELEAERDGHEEDGTLAAYWTGSDEEAELEALRELARQGEDLEDWLYGATLIRDTYFTEYARELAEDIGATAHGQGWPLNCIDWEQAAWELRMDYTSLDFDGVTYWAR